ncbi:MAG TPA: glycosyltransferase family 9 protein [Marmoricola sp.]|nr:glycosyltransferase family 9 protein [Marmoricola sp.]
MQRVLVLRALGLGDFLTGVPAMRALRRAFPEHEIVLGVPSALEPLVSLSGVADTVLDTGGLEPVAWSGEPPELAVNLHGRGPESHRLLAALAPRRLVAFGSPEEGHDGPSWTSDEHEVRRWCRLVESSLGLRADPAELHLEVPTTPPLVPDAVVVHPGAAYPARRWPCERFAQVARRACERGHTVVVTGGPDETGLAEEVRRGAGLPSSAVLAGRTDLVGLAALVASARLVVCGDTGMAHLASAYSTPSVVLFGPTSPSRWGPPAGGPHVVLWHGDGTGDPWGGSPDPALLRIGVEEVLGHVEELPQVTRARTTPSSA